MCHGGGFSFSLFKRNIIYAWPMNLVLKTAMEAEMSSLEYTGLGCFKDYRNAMRFLYYRYI